MTGVLDESTSHRVVHLLRRSRLPYHDVVVAFEQSNNRSNCHHSCLKFNCPHHGYFVEIHVMTFFSFAD